MSPLRLGESYFEHQEILMPNQSETCGMWRVTEASLFASTLFFTAQFFPKRKF
jgi:hypothetical protein